MLSYKSDFTELVEALTSTGIPVGHGNAFKNTAPYIVWHESQRISFDADDRPVNQIWKVRVYFFTSQEYDDRINEIERAFLDRQISYEGPFVDYDSESKLTRYRYECEV